MAAWSPSAVLVVHTAAVAGIGLVARIAVARRRKGRGRNGRDCAGRIGRNNLFLRLRLLLRLIIVLVVDVVVVVHGRWCHHHIRIVVRLHHGCRPEVAAALRDLDEVTLAHGAGDKGRNRLAATIDAAATVIVVFVLGGRFVALLECAKVRNALDGHRSGIVGQLLLEIEIAGQVCRAKIVLDLLLHRLQSVVVIVVVVVLVVLLVSFAAPLGLLLAVRSPPCCWPCWALLRPFCMINE